MDNGSERTNEVALVGAQPRSFRPLFRELDRMMSGPWGWPFHGRRWAELGRPTIEWLPDIDLFEKDNMIVVRADLPGIKREDIDISVQDDMLVIRGHREEEKEVKNDAHYGFERATGKFQRAVGLPGGISVDNIEASYKDGVLQIQVPRTEVPKPKSVKIKVK